MIRLKNLNLKFQKRTLRVVLSNSAAQAFAGTLHSSLRNTDGSFRAPLSTDTSPVTRSAAAFLKNGGLLPGTVMVKGAGESFFVAAGANDATRPFGLLANFVGGDIDELGDENSIGVWRGPDSVYEVLAPAFDDAGTGSTGGQSITAAIAAATPLGVPVNLYAGNDGRLVSFSTPGNRVPVATLIDRPSASRIIVSLLV